LNIRRFYDIYCAAKQRDILMPKTETTDRQLVHAFVDALKGLPEVRAQLEPVRSGSTGPDGRYDAKVDVRIAGKTVTLLIEAKKALYPRDVRQALWQLKELSRRLPKTAKGHETIPLLIAEAISPGAKEILRDELVGYYDSGGSLFLPAEGVYLYVDKPPPEPLSKAIRSLFSGRSAQVLHALLMRHNDWFSVKRLSEQAEVSPATASQVLTELERFEWLASRGQGPNKERHLRDPAALLDAWVKQLSVIRAPPMRRYYVPSVRADELVRKIARVFDANQVEYAITHEAAGQRYAPFLSSISQTRCRLVIGPAADHAIRELDARVVNEGANLTTIAAKSPGELLFRERLDGISVASPIQVYLDLVRSEGRAKEMAEHLRHERIGF
jgi:hypothetical protein